MIELVRYKNRFWMVAEVITPKETITINKFYKVDDNWIYIYKTIGGSGIGWKAGDLDRKIFIGDSEFITREVDA